MPPPRQPRLASRKSVVTDRTLYEQAQDDSDVSPPPKQLPRAARHPPPAASASSSSTIFAQPTRRRSTRLSTESTATDSPATAPTAKLRQPPLSRAKNATKSPAPPKDQRKEAATGSRTRPRVEVEQDADDEGDRDNDEDGPVLAQPKPAGKPAGGNKRQKVAPSSTGDAGLGAAPTTRAGFVVRPLSMQSPPARPNSLPSPSLAASRRRSCLQGRQTPTRVHPRRRRRVCRGQRTPRLYDSPANASRRWQGQTRGRQGSSQSSAKGWYRWQVPPSPPG